MGRQHPGNSAVWSDSNGIWGGDHLPVVDWEEPTARIVLPHALMVRLGMDSPIIRYARKKRALGITKHDHAARYIRDVQELVDGGSTVGRDARAPEQRVILAEDGEWMIKIAIGRSKSTSGWSIATVFATNKPREKARWMKLIRGE